MKKVQARIVLMALVAMFLSQDLSAQQLSRAERSVIAEQSIQALKGGTLIVRLKSKNNKINAIEKLLAAPDVKESAKERLRKNLRTTIDERNLYNLLLTTAFDEYYTFSEVYYIYDTASVSLKNGVKSGIFLDKNLEFIPTIEIPDGDFFVAKVGTTDFETTTGLGALVIMDKNLKDLQRPFPYYIRLHSIGRLFVRVFNYRNLVKRDAKNIVITLEENLQFFYTKKMNN